MSNLNIKINLSKFKKFGIRMITGQSGIPTKCLIIPIEENDLFHGKDDNVYVDFIAFELKERKADSKDTHLVKQSFSKEKQESFTDEQKKDLPIFGNVIEWGKQNRPPDPELSSDSGKIENPDDLPF